MPWATPPRIWPSTMAGLMIPPQSSHGGAAGEGGGATPARARHAERGAAGVAEAEPDRLDRYAELVGCQLAQRRLVALTVDDLLGGQRDGGVVLQDGVDRLAVDHRRETGRDVLEVVGRSGRRLDVGGEAQAQA